MKFKTVRPLILFSVLANICMLAAPLHMIQVYDRVLVSGSGATLFYITAILAVFLVAYGFSEMLKERISRRIAARFALDYADEVYDATVDNIAGSGANKYVRDYLTVRNYVASPAFVGLFDVPFAPLFLLLLFVLHWQLGVLALCGALILGFLALLNKAQISELEGKARGVSNGALALTDVISQRSDDVRAMSFRSTLEARWRSLISASLNAEEQATEFKARYTGMSKSVRQILQITMMAWGAWLVLQGNMSGGMIFAASMLSSKVLQPIEQLIGGWSNTVGARDAYDRIVNMERVVESSNEQVEQPEPEGDFSAQEITLTVGEGENETHLLKDVSLSLKAGEQMAILGASGSGKTTLLRVLAGSILPTVGEVKLGGCPHHNWLEKQWGEYVGYLSQDITLFPGTIAENIARMEVEPDAEALMHAASLAGIHGLVNSFAEGYHTKVGSDDGVRLSSGQRQRIGFARAIYKNPKVLILDEPNSQLDKPGEEALIAALGQLKGQGCSVVVATQRKSLLQLSDHAMMLRDGEMVPSEELSGQTPVPSANEKPKPAPPQPAVVQAQVNKIGA